ncbi:MAG TPA: ABC transporter ATP-binding protein [Bacillota bacterium]|jgi:putative ABC transport system ATP-binding protein|nr:ABC transporter ATP-binding protein [Bacillota bacterium]HRS21277.1 ABC transporter ATP-binding protein [Clostridia bacterium]HQE65804.1 ABC transporter ATP-binding protein [Bacillota bacterium]HQI15376.1 ABC transporter ATP-binding protein [Bacillota bacterium]HQJ37720.1 ABC transporter ATP-binding protein [Bacillota bacterium]
MIEIRNMSKIYQIGNVAVTALDNISLSIKQHEFVSIVGPSGSGKSTLMNMIGCLDVPTSGEYSLDGMEVSGLTDDQLAFIRNHKIGFVFQGFNLIQKLNALENVELPLIYQGIPTKERYERSVEALKLVGLEDRIHHRPSELSGGQQQRVAIARALVGNPQIILADEPTGNLDSKSGKDIMNMLKELHKKGSTIVLITHDNDIAMMAERIVRIQDGKINDDRMVG